MKFRCRIDQPEVAAGTKALWYKRQLGRLEDQKEGWCGWSSVGEGSWTM